MITRRLMAGRAFSGGYTHMRTNVWVTQLYRTRLQSIIGALRLWTPVNWSSQADTDGVDTAKMIQVSPNAISRAASVGSRNACLALAARGRKKRNPSPATSGKTISFRVAASTRDSVPVWYPGISIFGVGLSRGEWGHVALLVSAGEMLSGPAGGRIPGGAVLVAGDRIAAAGTRRDVEALAPPGTRRADYPNGCLLPGLVDGHVHLAFDPDGDPVAAVQ